MAVNKTSIPTEEKMLRLKGSTYRKPQGQTVYEFICIQYPAAK
jgi:hypothetical protein